MIANLWVIYGLPCLVMALGVADVITPDRALSRPADDHCALIRLAMSYGVWPEVKLMLHFLVAGTVGWLLTGEWYAFGIVVGCVFSAIIGAAVVSNNIRLRVRG